MAPERPGLLTAAGVLNIIAGVIGIITGIVAAAVGEKILGGPIAFGAAIGAPLIAIGGVALAGGICDLKMKLWGLALAGSICAIICGGILGILSTIFTAIRKGSFA